MASKVNWESVISSIESGSYKIEDLHKYAKKLKTWNQCPLYQAFPGIQTRTTGEPKNPHYLRLTCEFFNNYNNLITAIEEDYLFEERLEEIKETLKRIKRI